MMKSWILAGPCGQVYCHGEAPTRCPTTTHVDRILRCEGHRPLQVLATRPNDQPACLQRDAAAFNSFSAQEEATGGRFTMTTHLPTLHKKAVTTELRRIPEKSFQECMQAWQRRMGKCIRHQEDYIEGGNL
ncbi:unnamed protein product [Clavelina lepadiformis]|uniref:Uncharacterized protein n=1 Tax=Clavelina lepadiformis TaxID=159417 RepID=A0ABP0GI61_CLALP